MKKLWPKTTKIYWDPDYNIPIIKPLPGQEDLFFILRLTEPGDARPAFDQDLKKLRAAIIYEFNDLRIYNVLFKDMFILFNKVPHWDQMWEVVSSGNVMGQLYYDPFRDKWRFRLTFAGAYILYNQGIVDFIRINTRIPRGKIIRSTPSTTSKQVVIVNDRGEVIGIGENTGEGVQVIKIFKRRKHPVETSGKPANLDTVIKHNEYALQYYEDRSVKLLRKLYMLYGGPVVVSYSGGKDSLIALYLTLKALGDAELLFNDTGLELPDTIKNVEYVSQKYGLKLTVASAGNIFWKAVKVFGPPGKDYRWCCKITKLVPLARTARKKWPRKALNIVGQRAFESIDRAKSPIIWRNRWIPHLISATPIQEWNQLLEWLYIRKNNLPYNPLYDKGFERLGCFLCPSSTLAEFKEVEKTYPELWNKWIEELEYWREKLQQPKEWITLGLWRWLSPAVAKQRLTKHIPGYEIDWKKEYALRLKFSEIGLAPCRVNKNDMGIEIVFDNNILRKNMIEQIIYSLRTITPNVTMKNNDDQPVISINMNDVHALISKNTIIVNKKLENSLEELADILKAIYRIYGCTKCGSCILWCPRNNIMLRNRGAIFGDQCDRCRICIDVCPVAEVLVERVVLPLITGDPAIWKRSSRRHGDELIKAFKEYGIVDEV